MGCNILFGFVLLGLLNYACTRDVHIVENGTHIIRNETTVIIQEPSGNVIVKELPGNLNSHQKRDNGRIASYSVTGTSYTYLRGTWTVPLPPTNNDGQTIYFYNSLENSAATEVIKCILQFQNGGPGWTVAVGYVSGSTSFETVTTPVNAGNSVEGLLELFEGNWLMTVYVNSVQAAQLSLGTSIFGTLNTAQAIIMEVINTAPPCTQYPNNQPLTVSGLFVVDNSIWVPSPAWQLNVHPNNCIVRGSVTSPSEVSIYWGI